MAQITSLFSRREFWLALVPLALVFLVMAWRLRVRWRPAWLLRVGLVGMILMGLLFTNLSFTRSALPERQIMVVDLSDSLSAETRLQAWQQAVQWRAGGENRIVITFGAQPEPALPEEVSTLPKEVSTLPQEGSTLPQPGSPTPLAGSIAVTGAAGADARPSIPVDGRDTDLAGALQMAERLLAGEKGKIILASDGLASQPSAVDSVVADLAGKGQTLDVIPLPSRMEQAAGATNDAAVGSLTAPKNLWAGTDFDLLVPVYNIPDGNHAPLNLKINGQDAPISAQPAGLNTYSFHITGLPQGLVTLQVTAIAPGDPFPGNNSAYTMLQVFAPPRVLFVTDGSSPDAVKSFEQNLTQSGIQVNTITPDKLPTNLDTLQNYRVIFLNNLLSSQIAQEQMQALQVFVSRMAGGLVFLGGRNSYTLGGYKGTLLEPMLPVKLEPPPRTERSPIVFQLILDRSGSMGDSATGDNPPIALAREAAMRAIETLRAEDYLGVLTFSDNSNWDVPLRQLGGSDGLKQAQDALSQVVADGSTNMYQAMQDALDGMAQLPKDAPTSRHILLLSDGQSTDGSPDQFRQLAQDAQARGISISTIALGEEADADLMTQIAAAGKGRFYAVKDPNDLPRILITESQAARSGNVQPGKTALKPGEADPPILSGIDQRQLPTLSGYNALSSKRKEGAEDVLVSASFGDPILSTWQYGLGRVVTWAGDIGQEWSGSWPANIASKFWSQVVQYALVDPSLGPAQVNVQVSPTRLNVEASVSTNAGDPLNLADVTFTYAGPADQTHRYLLAQKSAGVYGLDIARPPDGAYRAVLSYTDENNQKVDVPAPFAVNPPKEWLPVDSSAGKANLAAWAAAGHGNVIAAAEITTPVKKAGEQQTAGRNTWLERLLLALVLLWPVEIAVRRRWLPWR